MSTDSSSESISKSEIDKKISLLKLKEKKPLHKNPTLVGSETYGGSWDPGSWGQFMGGTYVNM